jgi:glycosyltransferase involved in cell wall biosynthesis
MPDMFEQNYLRLKALCGDSIEFTGIIKQSEIAHILAKATYTIFPCADPETFGISTLESIYYNTPVFTCEFAALEETAIDSASYKIRYPVTPNWMVPWIDQDAQAQLFADMVIRAYHTPYLHQQKQYACNAVADICEWDTVALQWHQHFCFTFGETMSRALLTKVNRINQRVHKVFGRRTLNKCELGTIA